MFGECSAWDSENLGGRGAPRPRRDALDTFSKYAILVFGVSMMLPFAGAIIDNSQDDNQRNPGTRGRRVVDSI